MTATVGLAPDRGELVKWKRLVLLVFIVGLLATLAEAQHRKNAGLEEQSHFSAEQDYVGVPVQRPVTLPEVALQILRNDERVLICLRHENKSPDQVPATWFVASEIHLDGPDEIDLVVLPSTQLNMPAENRCLFGANTAQFWVFRKTPEGYTLALSVSTLDLRVLSTRWKGYRSIEIAAPIAGMVSTVVYRFDGQKYRPYQKKSKPIS